MENRINIAELLKDCPTGMELDCLLFEKPVKYIGLAKSGTYIITVETSCGDTFYLTKEGYLYNITGSKKCIIFPTGKTTWEGFVPPCKFKDGDVISDSLGTCIFKGEGVIQGTVDYYCGVHGNYFIVKENTDGHYGDIVDYRLATEEEKQKLFDAIKENGYRWNAETKTLEKVEPIFKVGDRIAHKNGITKPFTISQVGGGYYYTNEQNAVRIMRIEDQDNYELVPNKFDINTLKPFDKVLIRWGNSGKWGIDLFGFYNEGYYHTTGNCPYEQCIPYECNEYLLGKTEDCNEYYKIWE